MSSRDFRPESSSNTSNGALAAGYRAFRSASAAEQSLRFSIRQSQKRAVVVNGGTVGSDQIVSKRIEVIDDPTNPHCGSGTLL